MKIIFRVGLAAFLGLFLAGIAVGQDYYGGYQPYQGQDYSSYGSSGYAQSYPGYGQNNSSGYGSAPYGYAEQSGPQGYRAPYGYDQYPGVQGYGRYDNSPLGAGSYGLPSSTPQPNQPTLRTRLTPPVGRGSAPEVRETTRVVTPSQQRAQTNQRPTAIPAARGSEEGTLYNNEIYWNGRDSEVQESGGVAAQSQEPQSLNRGTASSGANPAVRQARPLVGANVNQTKAQRSRPNIVRQETKAGSTPPPPPISGLKWGKEPPDVREQTSQSKQSFKWGIEGRPSMVGAEPGRTSSGQGTAQVSAQSPEQGSSNSLENSSKKFQWGRVQ
jgi:hypothetical protein